MSIKKNRYLLIVADHLTKHVYSYACRTTETVEVVNILTTFCDVRQIPDRIISDRGTCFTSCMFAEFCQQRGIKYILNSSRHLQASVQME